MNGKPESAMTSERERLASSCDARDEVRLQREREFERFGDMPDERELSALRAEIERRNLELLEDKSLLDALDRLAISSGCTLAVVVRGTDDQPIRWAGIEWDGREVGIREAIRESIATAKGTT